MSLRRNLSDMIGEKYRIDNMFLSGVEDGTKPKGVIITPSLRDRDSTNPNIWEKERGT